MMSPEVLDLNEMKENKIVLFSKLSILLSSIIFSPFFGAIIYCANLKRTNQTEKIWGTIILVVVCNFFSITPFWGFNIAPIQPLPQYISHLLIALLLIHPLWELHFKGIKYELNFPFFPFSIMICVHMIFFSYHSWVQQGFESFYKIPYYYLLLNKMIPFMVLPYLLIGRFVYVILKKKTQIK